MKRVRDPDELREAMTARGDLSQRELARLAECSLGTISFVLAGRPVSGDIARRIARTLKRPIGDLFVNASASIEQANDQPKAIV